MKNIADVPYTSIERLVEWHKSSKTFLGGLVRGIPILLFLVLIAALIGIFGLILFYLSKLSALLILLCILLPPIIITYSRFSGNQINGKVWKTSNFLSALLILFAMGFWMFSAVIGWLPAKARDFLLPYRIQFPLSYVESMAVDNNGKVFLAIPFYQRIQAYDNEGNFLKGWFIESSGGLFNIWIEDNLLHVAVSRTNKRLVMDTDGRILDSFDISSFEESQRLTQKGSITGYNDKDGNRYTFQKSSFFPKVLKRSYDDNESVLISDPMHLWMFKAPYPDMLFFVWGAFMLLLIKLEKLRYKYRQMVLDKSRTLSDD